MQDTIRMGCRVSYRAACQFHDLLGDLLRVADVLDFLLVLLATFHHTPLRIAMNFDSSPLEHLCVDHRERTIDDHSSHPPAFHRLRRGLRRCGFSIPR